MSDFDPDEFTGDDRDQEWLMAFFKFEDCSCGNPDEAHKVVPDPFGKRFALCPGEPTS